WIAARLARHRQPSEPHVQRRSDGYWIHINERKTTEGGTVAVYTNITEIKQAEEEIRMANGKLEQANDLVTEKNKTLEALSTKLSTTFRRRFIHPYLRARKSQNRVEPKEADGILLRYRGFHGNDRRPGVGRTHHPAEPLPNRDVGDCAGPRRDHRQVYRRCDPGVLRRSGN